MTYQTNIIDFIKQCQCNEGALGITSSPSTTLEITIDITEASKKTRTLGQMVYVLLDEDGSSIVVIGQIISIETKNRWHEDQSFKGIIKRYGGLPHLSGTADNRIATISVQACYRLKDDITDTHILGTSPSTGEKIHKMDNAVMQALMQQYKKHITYIGNVYGTEVDLPLWFKHFGKVDDSSGELGAGDAYHIGVFGKTGSGKTVTATYMLLGYAKNKNSMSILVFDPQSQFYSDRELLPDNKKLKDQIVASGMSYEKYKILEDIYMPSDKVSILAELLKSNGFIQEAFRPIYDEKKLNLMTEAIEEYFEGRLLQSSTLIANTVDDNGRKNLLKQMLIRFVTPKKGEDTYTKYITKVWGTVDTRQRLVNRINELLDRLDSEIRLLGKWNSVFDLFSKKRSDQTEKLSIKELVSKVIENKGNFIILDIGPKRGDIENNNAESLFIKVIEDDITEAGAKLYVQGQKANCLIVMDEAHRYIAGDYSDDRLRELNKSIVDAVRTTRKYGIGYMFITQTIESIDVEILKQMRIFVFGYGLTSGAEMHKVNETINNPAASSLYKSFIDPSSSKRYPFMFFGPVSPLSFTGSPLFLEAYTTFNKYLSNNNMTMNQ